MERLSLEERRRIIIDELQLAIGYERVGDKYRGALRSHGKVVWRSENICIKPSYAHSDAIWELDRRVYEWTNSQKVT